MTVKKVYIHNKGQVIEIGSLIEVDGDAGHAHYVFYNTNGQQTKEISDLKDTDILFIGYRGQHMTYNKFRLRYLHHSKEHNAE